jgi:hypothetical protein
MQIEIRLEVDVLYAIASGPWTLELSKQTFVELMDAVREHRPPKVLFDARQVTGKPDTMERYHYGEFCAIETRKLDSTIRPIFAYVMIEPVLDHARFGETVALNRGMVVKAFDNIDDALSWLAEEE